MCPILIFLNTVFLCLCFYAFVFYLCFIGNIVIIISYHGLPARWVIPFWQPACLYICVHICVFLMANKLCCCLCGVRQGGVLSPYLFAFYINDIIEDVRNSGFGIYIGSVFLGCILYADDILLLSGLQYMVNVCVHYGRQWDILFKT